MDTDIELEGALPVTVALAPECLTERGRGTTGNRLGSVSRWGLCCVLPGYAQCVLHSQARGRLSFNLKNSFELRTESAARVPALPAWCKVLCAGVVPGPGRAAAPRAAAAGDTAGFKLAEKRINLPNTESDESRMLPTAQRLSACRSQRIAKGSICHQSSPDVLSDYMPVDVPNHA